jgi:hypothetical protein
VDIRIEVDNLRHIRSGLARLADEAPEALQETLDYSADLLVRTTLPKVPRVSGAARGSIRATSGSQSSRVTAGGPDAPYFAWLDLGGRAGRNLSVLRPVIREGRYLYPSLREITPDVDREIEQSMDRAIRNGGLGEG